MFLYENCGVEKYEKNTLFDNQSGAFLFQNRITIILLATWIDWLHFMVSGR